MKKEKIPNALLPLSKQDKIIQTETQKFCAKSLKMKGGRGLSKINKI